MNCFKLVGLFLLTATMCVSLAAQNASAAPAEAKEEAEKARLELEKKAFDLLNQTADAAAQLKLPENRAWVYANAGELLWTQDAKRARQLFRSAADQIVLAQTELEKNASDAPIFNSPSVQARTQILQMIARRDADLALDLLIQTRTARLLAELQKAAAFQSTGEGAGILTGESRILAQNELRLEQSFASLAAANNPEKAAKMIRENLAKNGVTSEVFQMLRRLNQKDEDAAKSLLNEVVDKLLAADLARKDNERRAAVSFLMQFAPRPNAPAPPATANAVKQKILTVDDRQLKDVANKIVDNFLQAKNYTALGEISGAMSTLEKLVPERAAQLKQKQAALKKTAPASTIDFDAMNAVNRPDAAPEDLIKNAAKVPSGMRGYVYERAVAQLFASGNEERARQLLNEAPASAERDRALTLIDRRLAEKAAREGKFDEARKLIGNIAGKQAQIEQMVALAKTMHAKKTAENREAAAKLMDEARQMLSYEAENEEEINAFLAVAAGYAVIEPERAFKILEPLVLQTNELMQALALVAKFNTRDPRFRNGEMSFISGMGQIRSNAMRYRKEIALLAAFDFDRARMLAERLSRPEAQIAARLFLAQSILESKSAVNGGFTSSGDFIVVNEE